MKYWLATTEYPPIHGGGISTYCYFTAKMLTEKGHEVTVFINDYSVSTFQESEDNGVKIIRFKPEQTQLGKALGYEARLSLEFAHIIEQQIQQHGAPDILEFQDYLGIGYYSQIKQYNLDPNFRELKILVTIHAPSFLYLEYNQVPHYQFPHFWTGEMEKASIKMANLAIAPSNYIVEEIATRMDLAPASPIRVFNPFINEWSDGNVPDYEEGDLCFFGKLTPQKGCIEMFQYFKKLWDKGFNYKLNIIGGGKHFFYTAMEDMDVYFKKKYQPYFDRGLITYEGNLKPEVLKERLKKAHLIITPSIVDNLPYAVLEAMALGKVVLGSNQSGHKEVIQDGKSGYVFSHDFSNFESQLTKALSLSESEVKAMGKMAMQRVEELTNFDSVYQQKMALIEKTCSVGNEYRFIQNIPVQPQKEHRLQPGFSVVVPYYNMGAYIQETVDSILNCDQSIHELIIVNDGSTDQKSIDKLVELESTDKIRVVHQDNQGLSAARNTGARAVTTDQFAFLDADDTVEPSYYTKAAEILNQYSNVDFVGCWAQYFENSTDIWPAFNPEPPYLLVHNTLNSSGLVYKTQAFLNFGWNDPNMIYGMEDYDSVISMTEKGARGVVIPETLWNYRIRTNSMAQSFNDNKELYLYRLLADKHQAIFNQYGSEISNLLNQNGPGINYDNPTKIVTTSSSIIENQLNSIWIHRIKRIPLLRSIAKKIYRKLKN